MATTNPASTGETITDVASSSRISANPSAATPNISHAANPRSRSQRGAEKTAESSLSCAASSFTVGADAADGTSPAGAAVPIERRHGLGIRIPGEGELSTSSAILLSDAKSPPRGRPPVRHRIPEMPFHSGPSHRTAALGIHNPTTLRMSSARSGVPGSSPGQHIAWVRNPRGLPVAVPDRERRHGLLLDVPRPVDGPLVLETPSDTLGLFDDMWFRWITDFGLPGADRGQGGTYLLVPPGYDGPLPEGGCYVRHSAHQPRAPCRPRVHQREPGQRPRPDRRPGSRSS